MRNNTKYLAINGILAGLYIVLTTLNPIGWGILQFRISTAILPIGYANKKLAPGIILGVLISNFFSPFGLIDVLAGFIIHFSCYYVFRPVMKNIYQYCLVYGLWAGLVLAVMFKHVLGSPIIPTMIPLAISNIAVAVLGAVLYQTIVEKNNVFNKI